MARIVMAITAFLPSSLCVAGAVYLAVNRIDGWGWFLFVAVCLAGSVKFGEDTKKSSSSKEEA